MWRFAFLFMICGNIWAKVLIVYPQPEAPNDRRGEYAVALLRLALSEAQVDYELRPSRTLMMQERAFEELKKGNALQVMWTMTTREREAQALPIRIPIYKGLIGWRLPLVHVSRRDILASVRTLDQLKALDAGQARDWPDADIMQASGLPVTTSTDYTSLFRMLARHRFDYMPRSVVEVWDEADAHRDEGLVVDSHIVLHYPAAVYFFVNKQNTTLANVIATGLERAIANGKFNRLFNDYHAEAIERSQIEHRIVIELPNPLLPSETPLNRNELWYARNALIPRRTPHDGH